jgi:amino acid transporter
MILSLVICTSVYILLTLVLSGAVNYRSFDGVGDPLAFIFESQNLNIAWMQVLVAICAVIAMTSVLLVFQLGQPRIWMSMSRDGLLPRKFNSVHPRYKTPSFATIVTGLVVGIPLLFTDKTFVLDFTSIATLFAFVLVCGGVLLIPRREKEKGRFHMPYINGRLVYPALVAGSIAIAALAWPQYFRGLFDFNLGADLSVSMTADELKQQQLQLNTFNVSNIIFWITCICLSVFAFLRRWSLIPLLGVTTCMYLLTGMTAKNWLWFASWLGLGLIIYFLYGRRHSKLNKTGA